MSVGEFEWHKKQHLDELEERKNAGHQDMKAAPAVEAYAPCVLVRNAPDGWKECKKHAMLYAPDSHCLGCYYRHPEYIATPVPVYDLTPARVMRPGSVWTYPPHTPETPAAKTVPMFMSTDSAVRKLMPVATGCLNYFPDALLCVAFISRVGNDKHNPGQPLHWAKEKSTDEPDAEVRHMLDYFRGEAPDPGLEPLGELGHLASKAWRALAHLQRACDAVREETTKGTAK